MPMKTRATRQKIQKTEPTSAPLDDGLKEGRDNPAVAMTAWGLPTFPAELWLEIMAYLPRPSDPSLNFVPGMLGVNEAKEHQTWREVASALSQTCQSLRHFFRPYLWRRIEVWEGMIIPGQVNRYSNRAIAKAHNLELVRQLEIVTVCDPTLSEYVQVVDVDVTTYSDSSVLSELARCLSLFPNLCIVKIGFFKGRNAKGLPKMVEKAFSRYSYPQVSTAIISKWMYPFLSFCPNLLSIRWMDSSRSNHAFENFRPDAVNRLQFCSRLESLAFPGDDSELLADIINVLPNLRYLVLHFIGIFFPWCLKPDFEALKGLKRLQKLEVFVDEFIRTDIRNSIIVDAKSLLVSLQEEDGETKEIIVGHSTKFGATRESILL